MSTAAPPASPRSPSAAWSFPALLAMALAFTACGASSGGEPPQGPAPADTAAAPAPPTETAPPSPDPRLGLRAGLFDAEQAIWNMRLVSNTPPPPEFVGVTNSDLAFKDDYVLQGNYNGYIVWDISDPAAPALVKGYVCPASQSDVSVYGDLLFVSGEGLGGRIDCGTEGVPAAVSQDRLRGIRIFDISDVRNPVYVGNVQTCRGSHTHSLHEDPDDPEHVYVYVSGSAGVRPEEELPGCSGLPPDEDPETALFRIEVIRVPVARPQDAAIVSSPRIFEDLVAPPEHGLAPADIQQLEEERAQGGFIVDVEGEPRRLNRRTVATLLDSIVEARGATGEPTAADSAALRTMLPEIARQMEEEAAAEAEQPGRGPTQCHDITLYPAEGVAGGACGGYGLLLDVSDAADPRRLDAVADSNFSYWHSATFDNEATKVLFSDEWGGGSQAKCRESDPPEWGANAIFTIENGRMVFQSYYKLPVAQTPEENCVAHNGSLIPIPGRDVMVQGWYQGGISVFDWTDPANPVEIAYFDRGPADSTRLQSAGSWSAYWYNGQIVSSEIARGLDILELTPSGHLSANEIEAARTVELDHLNAQGQPRLVWPPSFALAGAFLDQLERSEGLTAERIVEVRQGLAEAERASGSARYGRLDRLAERVEGWNVGGADAEKVRMLVAAVRDLAAGR